jgi:aminoglycoside phosphotransferase (APT) family kinase protein
MAAVRGLAPSPLRSGELEPYLERLEAGEPFKAVLEALLLDLPIEKAEHLGLILREGRGSWLPLLRSRSGRALFIGNALSGTVHVLAALGFRPHIHEVSQERMRFESFRCQALTGVTCEWSLSENSPVLPFADREFDLVIQEAGAPAHPQGWAHDTAELRRVSAGEVAITANNRLGYKRSLGRRGRFAVPSPMRFLKEILSSPDGERTLRGYREEMSFDGCSKPRAFSIYPHAADFTHVVAIDEATPRLHVGPKERKNRLKVAAYRAGLFPWLTPSYAIVSTDAELEGSAQPRIEAILRELSEQSGEALPEVDELIASRGNCIVLQTRPRGGSPLDEEGSWSIHIGLSPHKSAQVERHYRVLEQLWQADRPIPVPEPIFFGTIEGACLSCERRLPGLSAPQLSGDPRSMRQLLEDTARHLQQLVVEPPAPVDEAGFAEHFDWRFDLVAAHAGRQETATNIQHMRDEVRELVLGEPMPLVLQHADLRNKHVQVHPGGKVIGYMDWGSSRNRDVPYFDLLQLIVHEHKQAKGGRVGHSWQKLLVGGQCADWERAALDTYAENIGLSPQISRALELCFPIFVAAMAESNWDYSRPRWVHHSFGI